MEAQQILRGISSRRHQWQRLYTSVQGLNHSPTVQVSPAPIHNCHVSSTAVSPTPFQRHHPPQLCFICRGKREAWAPASEQKCHINTQPHSPPTKRVLAHQSKCRDEKPCSPIALVLGRLWGSEQYLPP